MAATRTVAIAIGSGSGGGVSDTSDTIVNIPLPNVTSGVKWFLIGALRTWQVTNATAFAYIEGTADRALPARPNVAGDEDFQPLALVEITAGQTVPTNVVDLRVIGANSGTRVADDVLVLTYLDSVGTQIRIDGTDYHRTVTEAGVATWTINQSPVEVFTSTAATKSQGTYWTRRPTCRLERDGKRRWLHVVVNRGGAEQQVGNITSTERGGMTDSNVVTVLDADRPPVEITGSGRVKEIGGNTFNAGTHMTTTGIVYLNSMAPSITIGPSGPDDTFIADFFWSVA
jgi:hypothetical protein